MAQLSDVPAGRVVRNLANGSYYRTGPPEGGRVRIRPLEAFANGLLIEKPTDTIVDCGLEVEDLGPWAQGFGVWPVAPHLRRRNEAELERKQEQLAQLQRQALEVEPRQRGSHANRVKAVASRIEALQRGLAERAGARQPVPGSAPAALAQFSVGDVVQLPSGAPAAVLELTTRSAEPYALVRTRAMLAAGGLVESSVSTGCLRPWSSARRATT